MKIIPIEGGTITKLEDALSLEECKMIHDYMLQQTNKEVNPDQMPWFQGNTLYYRIIPDPTIKALIKKHRDHMIKTIEEVYGEKVYGHLTTVVLWKPGQWMGRHHDQGNKGEEHDFHMRAFTSLVYLNDGFQGGETFIRNDGQSNDNWRANPSADLNDYISVPKTGNGVLFYGDDRNAHGVKKLLSDYRITLSTWFTTDPQHENE